MIFSKAMLGLVLALGLVGQASAYVTPRAMPTQRAGVRTGRTIVMDGKSNAIRDRIKSVGNTKKITEAMRLVAAAKVRPLRETGVDSERGAGSRGRGRWGRATVLSEAARGDGARAEASSATV